MNKDMIEFLKMMADLGFTKDNGDIDFGRIATILYLGRKFMVNGAKHMEGDNTAVLEWLETEAERFYEFSQTH